MTVVSGIPYVTLMVAFGLGVWMAAGGRRAGPVTGTVPIGEAVWGFAAGLLFPMAMRGAEASPRNDLHAVYGIGMPILFLLATGFGSRLLGALPHLLVRNRRRDARVRGSSQPASAAGSR